MKRSLLWLFVLIVLASCSAKMKREKQLLNQIEKQIGKTIVFPDSLEVIQNGKFISYLKDFVLTNPIIAVNIDGNCHACIAVLKKWEKMIKKHNEVQFIFFVSAASYKTFQLYLEQIPFNHPVVHDPSNSFVLVNSLTHISEVMLIDSNRISVLIGDPTLNKKVHELYNLHLNKMTAASKIE